MTLEEAKSILEQEKRLCLMYGRNQFVGNIEAIDTILKALDNSISKDEVRKKIKELKCIEPRDDEYNFDLQNEIGFKLDILQELLGEE